MQRGKITFTNIQFMNRKFIIAATLLILCRTNLLCTVYTGTCGRVTAYNKVDSANLVWHLDTESRVLTISGSGMMRDYDSDTRAPWYQYRNDFDRIWVSDSATCIGQYAFYDLLADSIHIGNSVTEIRDYGMYYSSFRSLVIPFATKTIGGSACSGIHRLKQVIFAGRTETINSFAFAYCDSLQTVDLKDSRVDIGGYAFYNCRQLRTFHGTKIITIDYYAFYENYSLSELEVGDTLQRIGDVSFYGCSSLTKFVLPASTSQITGSNPFANCPGLDSLSVEQGNAFYDSRNGCNAIIETATNTLVSGCVNTIIPNDCEIISFYAFHKCTRLTQINIPNSVIIIDAYAFESCSGLTQIVIPNSVTDIKNNAFASCTGLLNVTLSDAVSFVGCDAFYNCRSLLSPIHNSKLFVRLPQNYSGIYTMPEGIEEITCGAINYCDSLTSIVLPQSLRRIKSLAFHACRMLDTITIPKKVYELADQTFLDCYNLRNINLPDSITEIASYLLYNCKIQSINIPDAVNNIGNYAFTNCRSLKHVSIPANLQTISNPFEGCDSLNSVVWNAKDCRWNDWGLNYYSISDNIKNRSYTYTAFYSVRHNIKSFVIGDSVRVIPRFLCYEMDSITSINIPANVDSIERCAFDYCNSVTSISWNSRHCNSQISYIYSPFYTISSGITSFTFGDSVRMIPSYLCHGMSSITQLHIPSLVSHIGPYAFRYLNQLDTIWVNSNNGFYDSRNNCNALLETATDSLIIGCWKTNIPQDSRSIAPYAFRNVRRLKKIVIPEGVSYIGEEAFNGCKELDSVILPSSLTTIRDYTFQDCDSLRYLRMPDSLRTVGLRAFSNCKKLPTLSLAESLTYIDDYAFSNCTGLLDIYCNAINPPTITNNTFDGSTCPIYVPCPQVSTYRSAPNWYDLRSRINGQYFIVFDARPNDYSFGDVIILQEPGCAASAKVEARPVAGYDFLGWVTQNGDTVSRDLIFEFDPVENITLTGIFRLHVDPKYNITLIAKPDDITHGSAVIVIQPDNNHLAEVEARPASGYTFVAWTTEDGDTISKQSIFDFDPETIYNDGRDTVVVIAVFNDKSQSDMEYAEDNLNLNIWTDHEIINIFVPEEDWYYLYDISGMLIDSYYGTSGETIQFSTAKSGVYIVKSSKYSVKVVTK